MPADVKSAFSPALLRRFRPLQELGRGGGGVVYLVEDLADALGRRVLKLVRSAAADPRRRMLRREFEQLRKLRHPGLVPVLDFGEDRAADVVWFTSEYVAGPDLFDASARYRPADLCEVLSTLAATLQFLHDRGVLHNDIKPSNIRVPAGPASVRLLDFGHASLLRGETVGGTPPYMAPERLARPSAPGTVQTDLFSLGVTLYACATRRPPFAGEAPGELLEQIAAGPTPPRVLRPDLPRQLEEIVLRLLARDPRGRHQSAAALLADLESGRPLGARDAAAPPLPSPPLLGREPTLLKMRNAWERVLARSGPERLLLLGEAGLGKSRLLVELKQELDLAGAAAILVQCHRTSPRAWGLVVDLANRLSALPNSPPIPAGEARAAFAAVATAAASSAPIAVLVDDIQWADPESIFAVLDFVGLPTRRLPILLCATAREEPAATFGERWRAEDWAVEVLPALAEGAQRQVIASLFPGGEVAVDLIADAVAQAAGNPLALEEIARAWVASRAIRKVGGVWRGVAGVPRPEAVAPLNLVRARVQGLPGGRRDLLSCLALHGRPLPPAVLARLSAEHAVHLAALLAERLAVDTEAGADVRHPLVRQAAVELLSEAAAASLHLRLAEALRQTGAPPEDRWQHLLRGGDTVHGLPLALQTGGRAEEVEDWATGRAILQEALSAARAEPGALDPAGHARLRASLAACLDETGAAAKAVEVIEEFLPGAPAEWRPLLLIGLGRALARTGEFRRAEGALREARESSPDPRLRIEAVTWLTLLVHDRRQEARAACLACRPLAADLEGEPSAARLVARFYYAAAFPEADMNGPDEGIVHCEAALRVAQRHGLAGVAAQARNLRASCLTDRGDLDAALAEFGELQEILGSGASTARWMTLCLAHVHALIHRGDLAQALALLAGVFERGNANARLGAARLRAEVLADLGDPRATADACEAARQFLEGRYDPHLLLALAAGLRCAVWLRAENLPSEIDEALARIENDEVFPSDRPYFEACLAFRALLRGDADAAARKLAEAASVGERFVRVVVPRCRFHLAYALALCGREAEARQEAEEAARGYNRLGNPVEAARARALAAAIAEGRLTRGRPAAFWFERLASVASRPLDPGEPRQRIVEAAATAADATAAWLLLPGDPEPRVAARAGPCAAGEPVAWRDAVAQVLALGAAVHRRGVGVALPLPLAGEAAVLVVEDRAFPQAFAPEAASAAELALRGALDRIEREQLGADLAQARRAVERADISSRPTLGGTSAATVPARAASRRVFQSRLLDLSLGPLEMRHGLDRIVGRSEPMRRALEVLDRIVDLDVSVLVLGETGTGKELVARALHELGPRAAGPFVAVNCGAVPVALAESEFFGHLPGAFTGAGKTRRAGLFEQASGGTLFLDEVGELPAALQAKLLRVLEEGQVRPLGGEAPVRVDVRVVAASNRDLRKECDEGRFRGDLYFRLAVVELRLPPLRERPEDIPPLARHLLAAIGAERATGRGARRRREERTLSPEALDALMAHPWSGNVRELRNELERAAALSTGGLIRPEHLSPAVRLARPAGLGRARRLRDAVASIERRLIAEALRSSGGNRAEAARTLGLTWNGLQLKLKRYGLLRTRSA